MADRAIIPGASQEFLAFMAGAFDAPHLVRENPDAGLVSCVIFVHFIFRLCFMNSIRFNTTNIHQNFTNNII
jgi:hypothetical protein